MEGTHQTRLNHTRRQMTNKGCDAFLVLIEENRRYLSGFTGEDHQFDETAGALFITSDAQVLVTDTRFETQARNEAPGYRTVIYREGVFKCIAGLAGELNVKHLGFEGARLSVRQHGQMKEAFTSAGLEVTFTAVDNLVEALRQIKSAAEIENTKQALALAEAAFIKTVKTMRPGMTEKQVAWDLERGMREAGADAICFPVIVAAGPNSALPHAIPSDRPIQAGEPILFDWGARLNGYCSDTSRTVIIGPPDDMFLNVHHTVLEAQQHAIAAIKSGVDGKAVDAVARDYIHQNGYAGKFGHGLGHGTGLAVHEAPRLSPIRNCMLQRGMIVTVEPGIYLPEWGGVRIEHQVVVQDPESLVLNRLSTTYDITQL
ncbi:MAG: aminopeptidase P family protein [Desulfatitalea sp.]|nr:Xaa-Pro peptidase family protein [Desulfatitalea sp.]NNJ99456.1 aminopeptidase P family protein [Desulfatitalea sp.]